MYPWQIQHIPFSCKQGKKGASQHLFSVPVFFLSSDSLRSPDVHCSAHLEREREQQQQQLGSHLVHFIPGLKQMQAKPSSRPQLSVMS